MTILQKLRADASKVIDWRRCQWDTTPEPDDQPDDDYLSKNGEAALEYAAYGLPVFPCNAEKKPLNAAKYANGKPIVGTGGHCAATTDEKQITEWWTRWPDALIGMPTGKVSGIDVLDLDLKNGKDGFREVPNWRSLSPVIVRTRTGGAHLWFKSSGEIPSTTDLIALGVDTRGEGGYACVPPGGYRFERGEIGDDLPPFPADLKARLQEYTKYDANENLIAENPDELMYGFALLPNNDLSQYEWNKIGMALWSAMEGSAAGRDAFDVFSRKSKKSHGGALARWEHYFDSPPDRIGAGYLYHLIELAAPGFRDKYYDKQEKTEAEGTWFDPVDLWGSFDPPELPAGLLPDTIERFARIEGANMGCDPAGLAMSALTVCAAAIPDKIKLQVKEHDRYWLEPARVWAVLVGDPSTKKSPQLYQAVRPVAKIDGQMVRDYLADKRCWDELSAEQKKTHAEPTQQRIKIEDTTIEAAQEVLKNSTNGVLCLQDELSGFFGAMDKYNGKGGASADRAFWLKAYNGGEYSYNRVARGSAIIPNLSVCLLGGIQPDAIRKVAADGIDDGLLQRNLFIVLRPSTVDQDKPRDEVVEEYGILVSNLHMLANDDEVPVLRFDRGAQAIRNQLAEKHVALLGSETVNKKLATHVQKYDGVFARLCVLWHCIEHNEQTKLPTIVTEETARRVAAFLHGFLFKHAVTFYAGILGLSDDHDRLSNVAGYILAHGLEKITNRDVQRGDRTMRKLTDFDTLKIFEQLEALGWLRRERRPRGKVVWNVNKQAHVLFKTRAEREAKRRADARAAIHDALTVRN